MDADFYRILNLRLSVFICGCLKTLRHARLARASGRLSSRHCEFFVTLFHHKTRGRAFRPPNESEVTGWFMSEGDGI